MLILSQYSLYLFCVGLKIANSEEIDVDIFSDVLDSIDSHINALEAELYILEDKLKSEVDKVDIKLYYESLCPDCRQFDNQQFTPIIENLSGYLNIHTYPYGNAQTINKNGHYYIKCQHGVKECYGNKLHACAIDTLKNITMAVIFNSCMMSYSQEDNGSDDPAADKCGKSMGIETAAIKECAKSEKGNELLKYYGDESHKVKYNYVPYVLVNGKEGDYNNFMKSVCAAFKDPPQPCHDLNDTPTVISI